jgi:hypothetical protein
MNRLTAIGLASLVAYGLLITSKYVGVVSAARQDAPSPSPSPATPTRPRPSSRQVRSAPQALPCRRRFPASSPSGPRHRPRIPLARDLKAFADALAARRESLTADERYHLAKALEECQFATNVNEDLAAYSAKQRRAFLATLTPGDPSTRSASPPTRPSTTPSAACASRARRSRRSDIEDLFQLAAQQGDARAQARMLVADLNNKNTNNTRRQQGQRRAIRADPRAADEMQQLIASSSSASPRPS